MEPLIRIENLEIRNARPPITFTGFAGTTQTYAANAAATWSTCAAGATCP